ncbi:MAG: MarR family transcriptional regulator [Rhodospirillaceae bacterium]|nr:MarR family transcriptional regulator [Rhodospirillaceae bacterium]
MTDVYSKNKSDDPGNPDALSEESLRQAIEMLFFAYRDFTSGPDEILTEYGFGRAHHRAIYFVGRNSGLTVSALLDILKITKQSLNRVLGQLLKEGYVIQKTSEQDRRRRLMELTAKGRALERQLTENQRIRIARAYRDAGPDAVAGFRKVMLGVMSDDEDRRRFDPTNQTSKSPE